MIKTDLKKRFLREWNALPSPLKTAPLLVAVSGGMDSSVLAHVILGLRERLPPVGFAHVNYHLRLPDSDREEEFLLRWCQGEQVALHRKQVKPGRKPTDLQAWARRLRYRHFSEVLQRHGGEGLVCLAHHQRDQAETFLARLLRGSGPRGLGGMRVLEKLTDVSGEKLSCPLNLFRPFLNVPHQALVEYARHHDLNFCEDRSNQSFDYLRNRLRHQTLPLLTRENPKALELLTRLADSLRKNQEGWEALAADWLERHLRTQKGVCQIPLAPLKGLPEALQEEILRLFLWQHFPDSQSLGKWVRALKGQLSKGRGERHLPLANQWELNMDESCIQIRACHGPKNAYLKSKKTYPLAGRNRLKS